MANIIVICFLLLLTTDLSQLVNAEHESCKVWDNIAKQLSASTEAQHKCTSNGTDPCTRIDCSGEFQYNEGNTGGFFNVPKIKVDYCFGIILNHCNRNISLDFYLQVPAKSVDRVTRVYHNTLLSIPGLSYSIGRGTSAQGYLYFQMKRDDQSVTFSVTVKVRVSFAGINTWPSSLQRRLISNETVPVPTCESGLRNFSSPPPNISQCQPLTWGKGHQPDTNPPAMQTDDLDKPCSETDFCSNDPWLACNPDTNLCECMPDFEKIRDKKTNTNTCQPLIHHLKPCRSHDDCSLQMSERCLNGRCHCQSEDKFNVETQTCEPRNPQGAVLPRSTETPHVVIGSTASPLSISGSKNKGAILASSIVGGLVVLAGILIIAFFAIRRLRRPYHNRELLLEGEDSDGII